MAAAIYTADRQIWRDGSLSEGTRLIPEETALALTYNGGTYAVMMGTPQNLRDFAIGFSLSEGIIQSRDEIDSLDIVDLRLFDEFSFLLHIHTGYVESADRVACAYAVDDGEYLLRIEAVGKGPTAPDPVGRGDAVSECAIHVKENGGEPPPGKQVMHSGRVP